MLSTIEQTLHIATGDVTLCHSNHLRMRALPLEGVQLMCRGSRACYWRGGGGTGLPVARGNFAAGGAQGDGKPGRHWRPQPSPHRQEHPSVDGRDPLERLFSHLLRQVHLIFNTPASLAPHERGKWQVLHSNAAPHSAKGRPSQPAVPRLQEVPKGMAHGNISPHVLPHRATGSHRRAIFAADQVCMARGALQPAAESRWAWQAE